LQVFDRFAIVVITDDSFVVSVVIKRASLFWRN